MRLRHENAVLRRQIGRVRYQPGGRRWLAALSRLIPRCRWGEVYAVTAAALRASHRRLAAGNWDYPSRRRPGRPSRAAAIGKLVIRIATDAGQASSSSSATRIAASTVGQIRHNARTGPAGRRTGPAGRQVLTAYGRGILAAGFVPVDSVLRRRIDALIVIEHGTRRAHLACVTAHPGSSQAPSTPYSPRPASGLSSARRTRPEGTPSANG